MKKHIYKILFAFLSVMLWQQAHPQSQPEMADAFYAEGKIYVVIAVLAIVLAGIAVYLFALDRKLTAIEKEMKIKND